MLDMAVAYRQLPHGEPDMAAAYKQLPQKRVLVTMASSSESESDSGGD